MTSPPSVNMSRSVLRKDLCIVNFVRADEVSGGTLFERKFFRENLPYTRVLTDFSSRHVLNLRDNGLKSPSKQPRQEGKTTKGCAKWPSIGEWPTIERTIDIEQIVVTQRKQIT